MARIIENTPDSKRRIIQLSTNDVLSVVREYQRIVPRGVDYTGVRTYLEDSVFYIPEDV